MITNTKMLKVKPGVKAKELVNEYKMMLSDSISDHSTVLELAKKMAIVAVNEIITSRHEDRSFDDRIMQATSKYASPHPMHLTYWIEVSNHIDRL